MQARCPICKEPVLLASSKSQVADLGRIVCENEHCVHIMFKNRHFLVRTKINTVSVLEDSGVYQFVC